MRSSRSSFRFRRSDRISFGSLEEPSRDLHVWCVPWRLITPGVEKVGISPGGNINNKKSSEHLFQVNLDPRKGVLALRVHAQLGGEPERNPLRSRVFGVRTKFNPSCSGVVGNQNGIKWFPVGFRETGMALETTPICV